MVAPALPDPSLPGDVSSSLSGGGQPGTSRAEKDRRSAAGRALLVACAGMLGFAIVMGFGRFSYTAILPLMVRDGLASVHGGSMLASINLAGYLAGAMTGMAGGERSRPMIMAGMALTAISLAGMAVTHDPLAWQVLRFLSGVASAWGMVGLTHWGMRRLAVSGHIAYRGIVFSGPGLGIMVTGLVIPVLAARPMTVGEIWLVLGALSALGGVLVVAIALREHGAVTLSSKAAPAFPAVIPMSGPAFRLPKAMLALAYGLSGCCYIVPATFLPLIAREVLPGGGLDAVLWPFMGLMAALSTIAFGFFPGHHNARLLVGAYLCEAVGIAIPVFMHSLAGLALSSLMVGSTMMLVVMLTMDAAKTRYHDPSFVALLTAGYAIGQVAGPYMAGTLYVRTHSFLPSLAVSGAGLALSAALSTLEPRLWARRAMAKAAAKEAARQPVP